MGAKQTDLSPLEFSEDNIVPWLEGNRKPVVIVFTDKSGRATCNLMESAFLMTVNSGRYRGKVYFAVVYTDKRPDICRALSVQAAPVMAVFSEGKEQVRIISPFSQPAITVCLDGLLASAPKPPSPGKKMENPLPCYG